MTISQAPPPSGGDPVAALTVATSQTGQPGSYTLTLPESGIPAEIAVTANGHTRLDAAKFTDILLTITYKLA